MKRFSKWILVGLVSLVSFVIYAPAQAQCAMCRATVESSASTPKGMGKGINSGILYLMAIPYLMAVAIGYFWYKHSRKETAKLNRIEDVLRRRLT